MGPVVLGKLYPDVMMMQSAEDRQRQNATVKQSFLIDVTLNPGPLAKPVRVFRLVLGIVADKGLLRGKVVGIDSTYLRADASMKAIVRKDTGDSYQEYLKKLCLAEGIENPTAEGVAAGR